MNSSGLDSALSDAGRILVDSSVIIGLYSARQDLQPIARHLFSRIERGELRAFISVVTAAEVLVRPIRSGPNDASLMHGFLTNFPNTSLVEADLLVALQAANLRAAHNFTLPDALVIASGLCAGCEAFVYGDARWNRLQPHYREFRWVNLHSYK